MQKLSFSRAGLSLIITRMFYAVNWLNLAAIFSLIGPDFTEDVAGLGLVTFGAFIGSSLMQVPGGIISTKIGLKRAVVIGMVMMSMATILTGISTEFYHIVVLRFLVGVGAGFVYAPGVVLIARYSKGGSEGLTIGLFNSAYYMGGILGIFGWILIAELVGWRLSLVTSGVLLLVSTLCLSLFVPNDNPRSDFRIKFSDLRRILLGKRILLIGLGGIALQVGFSLDGHFLVYYQENHLGVQPVIAGIVGSLFLILALLASPVGGRAYDRFRDVRKLLFLSGLISAVGVAINVVNSVYAAAVSSILVGFSIGVGFTVATSAARDVTSADVEYQTLSVGWQNGMALFAGFWYPLLFSLMVLRLGYPGAWFLSGVFTLLLAFPILLARNEPR